MSARALHTDIDEYCAEVLRRRIAEGWLQPGDVRRRDIRDLRPDEVTPYAQCHFFARIGGLALALRLAGVPDWWNVWTAGFPCQDISAAGKGAGITGERSGLYFELARLFRGVRPDFLLLENVAALLARGRGFDRVLGELAEGGYDAEWDCVPASAVGAPHQRDRVWIVAYSHRLGVRQHAEWVQFVEAERRHALAPRDGPHWTVADASEGRRGPWACDDVRAGESIAPGGRADVADADGAGRGELRGAEPVRAQLDPAERARDDVPDADSGAHRRLHAGRAHEARAAIVAGGGEGRDRGWWATEPDVGRVAHGVPARVDRLTALGNAVVPQAAAVPAAVLRDIGRSLGLTLEQVA